MSTTQTDSVDTGDAAQANHSVLPNPTESPYKRRKYPNGQDPRLRYYEPYWWPYKTFVKERWIGRRLLEVVSTEFRDRSVEYYRHALESGVTRVNGVTASPDFVLRNGDRIDNTVHRHEPPITNDPILVLHVDHARKFCVISKPGSIPVHATGRYFRHTVLEIMESDNELKCYSVNRLDRLTSGLMILALDSKASRDLAREFVEGRVKKEYVARVRGKFPEGEVVVDQPLLTVDRQMGLVIVTPEGKEAKTIFRRMSYDEQRDQSILHCAPQTGRTHQIRVHLQYLGHPIVNDPLYSPAPIWGPGRGKGGVDLVPQPDIPHLASALASRQAGDQASETRQLEEITQKLDLEDREYSNIDITSPIRLSAQAREVIAKLRRARDEQEDWVKWKEVVFKAKEAQDTLDAEASASSPAQNALKTSASTERFESVDPGTSSSTTTPTKPVKPKPHPKFDRNSTIPPADPSQLQRPAHLPPGFCQDCFVPLPDDPDPETLFIFLHALRYTTENLGRWETPLPRWAGDGWDGDHRGWVDGAGEGIGISTGDKDEIEDSTTTEA